MKYFKKWIFSLSTFDCFGLPRKVWKYNRSSKTLKNWSAKSSTKSFFIDFKLWMKTIQQSIVSIMNRLLHYRFEYRHAERLSSISALTTIIEWSLSSIDCCLNNRILQSSFKFYVHSNNDISWLLLFQSYDDD